ncbi:MAG TPA: hypothetical protein VKU00_09410 [Chthonomonadaceae bacterium]|nr:hypothetical protein [Chthonomonadaceae bacterium]
MQVKPTHFYARAGVLIPLAVTCIAGFILTAPTAVYAQDRGHDEGRDRRDEGHRDRGEERRRDRDEDHARFTHSDEERHFENGVTLHRGVPITDHHLDVFFPHHYYSYPHYVVSRDVGHVIASPFGLYVGIFPPFIDRSAVLIAAPRHVYIDIPIYVHGDYRVYPDGRDDYYLHHHDEDDRWKDDPDLRHAVYDLEDTFRNEDIALLAPLTDPATRIAIFERGRYQYTVAPDDYLDMTRDFLRNAHTVEFTAYRVHSRARGVNQVFVRHVYQDQRGENHTVYLCMVMERIHDRWTITQIDTSPAHS